MSLLTQLAVFRFQETIATSVHPRGMEMYGFGFVLLTVQVRCYSIQYSQNMIASQMAARISLGSPAISACWNQVGVWHETQLQESTQIYAGDASGKVILWDLGANASQGNPIAQVFPNEEGNLQHNHSIVSVQVNTAANCLTVGSLDGNVRLYDLRTPSNCV